MDVRAKERKLLVFTLRPPLARIAASKLRREQSAMHKMQQVAEVHGKLQDTWSGAAEMFKQGPADDVEWNPVTRRLEPIRWCAPDPGRS
jgi:hypothetical protein